MADEIKQDPDAQYPTPAETEAQPELSGADELQHGDAPAGESAPADAPADAADVNGAAPQPAPEPAAEEAAQPEAAPFEATEAQPEAQPSDSEAAAPAGEQAGLEAYPAPEPAPESLVAGDAAAEPDAGSDPTLPGAAAEAPSEGEPAAPAGDAAAAEGSPAALDAAQPDADPAPEQDAPAAGDAQPQDGAAAGAGGDVELPFNSVGMAQLGNPGHQSGGPLEHPVPATVPRPADPITGKEVDDETHAALTGGLSKGDEAAQPEVSGLAAVQQEADKKEAPATSDIPTPSDDNLQHPVPALVPRPVVQGSSEELGQDDHAAVTGGLGKGDEAPQPEAPQPEAPAPASDAEVSPTFAAPQDDEDEDEGDEGFSPADEDLIERIRGLLHSEMGRVMDKFKHLEHEIKTLRRKR